MASSVNILGFYYANSSMHLEDIRFLCFGVGGMNGWVHIGILSALERELIRRGTTLAFQIRGASGASIGSLIAVAVVLSMSAEEIKAYFTECTEKYRHKMGTPNVVSLLTKKGLMSTDVLANVIRDLLARKFGTDMRDMTMGELHRLTQKTLFITTHNISKMRGEAISHTTHPDIPVHKAVCMSCAIPGIFEPVEHDRSLYIDSGLSNELPFEVFNNMEATLAFYLVGDHKPAEPDAITLQEFFYRITCTFGLSTEHKINQIPEHLKAHVLWLRVPNMFGKAIQGILLESDEQERLFNIGVAAGQTRLVHYEMAVLSQAATLYISSRRGLGVTLHPGPKIADVVVDGKLAAPDAPDVARKDAFQAGAAFAEGEPQGQDVLDEVNVDAAE